MRTECIQETFPSLIELSDEEADALVAIGRRLVGTAAFWGAEDSDDTESESSERTVIRCVRVAGNTFRVTVAEAVGIVAMPALQLVVQPKIPLSHFRFLLEHTTAFPRLEEQSAQAAPSTELWDLVATWFTAALERLMRRGMLADYEEQRDELPAVRGSIDLLATAVGYYQGRMDISCVFDEFALDSPLNRILKAAVLRVSLTPFLKPELRQRARRALARLTDVGDLRANDLYEQPDRRTASYRSAWLLARQLLAASGVTVESGPSQAWTFLIRTPEIVEDAVRTILARGLHDQAPVTKTGLQLKPSKLTLNPDLVFGHVAVGDVKYSLMSGDWRRSHLYQAVAFATGFGVNQAGVFGFSATGDRPPDVQVGNVALRSFAWRAAADWAAEDAADALLDEVRAWLMLVDSGDEGATN